MNRAMRVQAALLASALAIAAPPASAQAHTVTTRLERTATQAQVLGSQHRPAVDGALRAAGNGDPRRARELLQPVLAFCEGLARTGRRLVSVVDESEYTRHVAAQGDGEPVDWVDMACPEAYKLQAYIDVEDKQPGSAFANLDKAIRLAPYWADPLAERGYLLNQAGKPGDALASYQAALALADTHPGNQPVRALALRGIGYSQVELGDLDAADQAYRRSLEIEPGNTTATNELDYIRRQREQPAAKP